MSILNQQFFQMSNAVFYHGLKPIQLAVYSYLKCCAGKKGDLFPSDENHRCLLLLQRECGSGSHPGTGAAGIHLHPAQLPQAQWSGAANQQHLLHPGSAGHPQTKGGSHHYSGRDPWFWGGIITSRIKNRRRFAARSATNARSAGVFWGL